MKKLYEKNELFFALAWILIYCSVGGTLRGTFGEESIWLCLGLAGISACLAVFIKQNGLEDKYGLSGWPSDWKPYLYFIPMWIIATGNLWGGIRMNYSGTAQVYAMLSMALVGYAEELIFRGLLFKALLKGNGPKYAVIITALTFGIGHIVNLLSGQTTIETMIQIPFAISWGFVFTMVFHKSGSLLPGIAAHAMVDVFSTFAVDTPVSVWGYMIAVIIIGPVYCLYLKNIKSKGEL